MTQNERAIVFELAKAISGLTSVVRTMAPEGSQLATPELEEYMGKVGLALDTFIALVDSEWMPK